MRVLKFEDTLKNLVKKYNKGEWDEDLMQEAWLTAIKCEKENPDLPEENLKAKVITWVKNRLIDIQTKHKLEIIPLEEELIIGEDLTKTLVELRNCLTERENLVLDYLLEGKDYKFIAEKLNVKKDTVYRIYDKIKRILKG